MPAMLIAVFVASAFGASVFSRQQRAEIVRAFLYEHPYAHRPLPCGKTGAVIEGSAIAPTEAELEEVLHHRCGVARPGDRVQITSIRFLPDGILFEINGDPAGHHHWTEHIRVGMGNAEDPQGSKTAPSASAVLLKVHATDDLSVNRVKMLLAPVLDFDSRSQAEAFSKKLPAALAAAIHEHRALVGMNRDMVLAALGKPPRRLRESSGEEQYEEWIYGTPPQEVQFIRFRQGRVVRIEEVKAGGETVLRTTDELKTLEAVHDSAAQPRPGTSPTLRRPGELSVPPTPSAIGDPAPAPDVRE